MDILLKNRGIKTKNEKEEFFNPVHPEKISVKSLNLDQKEINNTLKRIKDAIKNKEQIIIFGDYDADGICATAILWECLYSFSKNVSPYIPSRFEEGYGANVKSIEKLKIENKKLKIIITVDNGIVANEAVNKANELGIDVIITDHHQVGNKLPKAYSIIHTDKISGSGIAWILARELRKKLATGYRLPDTGLELCAIGTISDQLPLVGPNRSFAKYGLDALNMTDRPGLLALFEEAGIDNGSSRLRPATARQVGTYVVNFMIAPRINAMGRLEHAIDSLRLLCTTSSQRASELAQFIGKTNRERQKIVEGVVIHALGQAQDKLTDRTIIVAGEYHEGVIGLAAAKLVEEYYRPAIVLSKGKMISKASARSISGFNIIEAIHKMDSLIIGGGGHPMAAGFTIETENIEVFMQQFEEVSRPLLTDDILIKRLKIDLELDFGLIDKNLVDLLTKFEPHGIGNFTPIFMTKEVRLVDSRTVGNESKHLKLTLEKDGRIFPAIAFGMGELYGKLKPGQKIDVAYNLENNVWNGNESLQLKIKDIKIR